MPTYGNYSTWSTPASTTMPVYSPPPMAVAPIGTGASYTGAPLSSYNSLVVSPYGTSPYSASPYGLPPPDYSASPYAAPSVPTVSGPSTKAPTMYGSGFGGEHVPTPGIEFNPNVGGGGDPRKIWDTASIPPSLRDAKKRWLETGMSR